MCQRGLGCFTRISIARSLSATSFPSGKEEFHIYDENPSKISMGLGDFPLISCLPQVPEGSRFVGTIWMEHKHLFSGPPKGWFFSWCVLVSKKIGLPLVISHVNTDVPCFFTIQLWGYTHLWKPPSGDSAIGYQDCCLSYPQLHPKLMKWGLIPHFRKCPCKLCQIPHLHLSNDLASSHRSGQVACPRFSVSKQKGPVLGLPG